MSSKRVKQILTSSLTSSDITENKRHVAYYHLIVISTAAVRSGQRGRTAFTVPWKSSSLTSGAHSDRVNASYVSVASTVVRFQASIPRSPHVNATSAIPALDNRARSIILRSRVIKARVTLKPVRQPYFYVVSNETMEITRESFDKYASSTI